VRDLHWSLSDLALVGQPIAQIEERFDTVEILAGTLPVDFWHWAKTRSQRRYPQRSRPSEQRRPGQKRRNPPYGREQKGRLAASLFFVAARSGMLSLSFGHPPLLPLDAPGPIPVFTNGPIWFSRCFSHVVSLLKLVAAQLILKRGAGVVATLGFSATPLRVARCYGHSSNDLSSFFSPLAAPKVRP